MRSSDQPLIPRYLSDFSLRFWICSYLQKLVDVLEFLKVPHQELKSRQVKIHKGSLSSHIENWDAVQKTLKGTKYEDFLRADYQK